MTIQRKKYCTKNKHKKKWTAMDCFFFIEFFLYLQYLLIRCPNPFYQVLTCKFFWILQILLNSTNLFGFCKFFWILQILLDFASPLDFRNFLNFRIQNFHWKKSKLFFKNNLNSSFYFLLFLFLLLHSNSSSYYWTSC